MGIVHGVCQATGLAVTSTPWCNVRVIVVADDGGAFEPVVIPIFGHYDDYGNIEKPALLDGDRAFVSAVLDLHARGELWWSDTAEITSDVSEQNLVAILEEIRQGMIFEPVRRDAPSLLMRAGSIGLHFVYVLDHFYDDIVRMQKASLSADERERLDEALDGPFEPLQRALGVPSLSARFVVDTPGVRDELVELRLFRSWFDAHRSWKPVSTGEQFSLADQRALARDARGRLAAWPPLVATLDRYEALLRPE